MDDIRETLGRVESALEQLKERMQPALPLVLTVRAAAAQLSVSERTMRTLLASGEVASVLLGGRRMVSSAELQRVAQSVARQAPPVRRGSGRARLSVDSELRALSTLRGR